MSSTQSNNLLKSLSEKYGTPLYIYDADIITNNIKQIKASIRYEAVDIHFALMCNANPHLLKLIRTQGVKAFVCSPGELFVATKSGFTPEDVILTGTGFAHDDLQVFIKQRIKINVDSLGMLERYGKLNPGGFVGIRINFDFHDQAFPDLYWGTRSRMGIWERDIPKALDIARQYNIKVTGIHQYSGTNIIDQNVFMLIVDKLCNLASFFPDIEYVDIGGGFGLDYKGEAQFNWEDFGNVISQKFFKLSKDLNRIVRLKLEPGRSIIATAGVLAAKVTDIKAVDSSSFVVTDTSLSNFIRPYLYNAYHKIEALQVSESEMHGTTENSSVCGNTVALNDFLAKNISLNHLSVNDLILIHDVGAYGYTMSSHFCGRTRPAEVLIENGKDTLIREREDFSSLLNGTGY